MFKSISWQEFILVVSIVAVSYYIVIIALFYSKDIVVRLKGVPAPPNQSQKKKAHRPSENLMGSIKTQAASPRQPARESSVAPEDIHIIMNGSTDTEDVTDDNSFYANELIQEVIHLFEIMKEGEPSIDAYIKNIKTLISQYPQLIGTDEQTRVTQAIAEALNSNGITSLNVEEVNDLWLKEISKRNNQFK